MYIASSLDGYIARENDDMKYWYSKIAKSNDIQPESSIFPILERLDIPRTRLENT